MIVNYNFNKNIKKNGLNFFLEINIPKKINNFIYKIYGNYGFFQYGKYSSYKNNDQNNILVFNIDKIQTIFISIQIYKKNIEYFDFISMGNILNNNNIKNITIDIKKKYSEENFVEFKSNNELVNNFIDSNDEDTKSLNSDENNSIDSSNEDNKSLNNNENKKLFNNSIDSSDEDNELSNNSIDTNDEDNNELVNNSI
jgi:hypothetical protein